MKRIFLVASVLLLSIYSLAAYSSIPEYNSAISTTYSSIGSYSSSPNNVDASMAYAELSENKTDSIDNINSEMAYENSETLIEESSQLAENSPLMMARGPLTYNGQVKLDDDGTGPSHDDKNHNDDTSFKRNGKSLNADVDSYVVAPQWLLGQGVKPGDRADVTVYFYEYTDYLTDDGLFITYPCNQFTRSISSIVGDFGPEKDSVGEISIKAARDLGLGVRERSNRLGPVPTDPHDRVNPNRDIYATVTYYPSGS